MNGMYLRACQIVDLGGSIQVKPYPLVFIIGLSLIRYLCLSVLSA